MSKDIRPRQRRMKQLALDDWSASLRPPMTDPNEPELTRDVYQALVENLEQAVFVKDRERRFTYVNPKFCDLVGHTATELLGKLDEDFFPTEMVEKYRHGDLHVLETGQSHEAVEELATTDGDTRYIEVVKKPLRSDGEINAIQGIFWDVTSRILAERKSKESEERFYIVSRATNDTIWDWDMSTNRVWWSQGIKTHWGFTDDQIGDTADWWIERLHPDDKARVMDSVKEALESESLNWGGEYRYRRGDGSYAHILDRGRIIRDENGKAVRMIGSEMDITDRVASEQALHQSEDRFRRFMNNAPAVAWIKDGEHRIRYANSAFEKMFHTSADELMGQKDQAYLPADVAETVQANDRRVMESRKAIQLIEHVPDADQHMKHWLVTKFPLPNPDGTMSVGGMAFEITDRINAEAALKQSEERLKLTVEASRDAVWDVDLHTERVWCNDTHQRMFGSGNRGDSWSWDWWKERIHPDDVDETWASFDASLQDPKATLWKADYRFRSADGRYLYVQDHAYISRNPEGEAQRVVGSMRDLTELNEAQAEKMRMDQKMQEAQKLESLGVLAGGIAHDFNNLLTSILGNVNLAQMELPSMSSLHAYLEDVEKASIRAADLCKQMLAYSGRGRFVIKRIDLSSLVEEMVQLLQVSISKTAVLKFNVSKGLPAIAADPTQIRQIVMNLVINASEAIGEKSGIISISTGLMRVDRDYLKETFLAPDIPEGDYVYIEVSDSGCGMDRATRDRIFDPFYTTKFTGRGLGLAAVLGIVRGHKGTLKVYSEPERGSTFKLLLPCDEGSAEDTSQGLPSLAKTRGEGLILVCDDEETVRATSARMLESAGYSTQIAADGKEGLDLFNKEPDKFRLVLLDLTMPHMDGVETFCELRRVRPDIRVVLMSGYNEQEAVERFTGKGLAGFVQKPFQIQTLLGKVKEALDAGKQDD